MSTVARLRQLGQAGFGFSHALLPLVGRSFRFREEYWLEAGPLLTAGQRRELVKALEDGRAPLPFVTRPGRQVGFGHSGTYGQYLMVYPKHRLVVVRLVRRFDPSQPRVDFEQRVMTLVNRSSGGAV